MDIRNFFNAKSKEQPGSKNAPIKNRPKPLISDSSDEEMVEGEIQHNTESVLKVKLKNRKPKNDGAVEKKARKRQLSDSSNDEFEPVKQPNPTKQTKLVSTLKPVDAKDFFKKGPITSAKLQENSNTKNKTQNSQSVEKNGKNDEFEPVKQSNPTKQTKVVNVDSEQHDDPNFNKLLLHMNDNKNKLQENSNTKNNYNTPGTQNSQSVEKNGKNVNISPQKTSLSSKTNGRLQLESKPKQIKGPFTSAKLQENSNTKNNYNAPGTQNSQSVEKNGKNVNISPQKTSLSSKTNGRLQLESKPIQVTPTSSQDGSISSQISNQGNPQMRNSSEKVSQLWVEKYKPTGTKNIIGQQGDRSNLKKLQNWLKGWDKHHGIAATGKPLARPPPWGASKDDGAWAKAALLSGPPGVGKTTTSYLVAKEMGYEIMETNASDTRSKKALDNEISDAMSSKSVTGSTSRR